MMCTGSGSERIVTSRPVTGGGECWRCSYPEHRQIREHHRPAQGERTRSAEATDWVTVEHISLVEIVQQASRIWALSV